MGVGGRARGLFDRKRRGVRASALLLSKEKMALLPLRGFTSHCQKVLT